MGIALGLARRGHGNVWPNPSVGCVVVRDGIVVGRGWTQPGGRPHAETEALARAGSASRGATAYVTLEPCAHHGRTPPCADAFVSAGVARVVVALQDPDPRVDGGGIARLRAAGIEVETGVCADQAAEVAAGFLLRIGAGRPQVTVKLATTLDGRIATGSGESRWITGEVARALGHGLRARCDAILVGAATAALDDPDLTCRLPGLESRSPVRVVVDGATPLPPTHKLVAGARDLPTIVLVAAGADAERRKAYTGAGAEIEEVPRGSDGRTDLAAALQALGARGITRLLVEGGGRTIASLMREDLVDRLVWFRAPRVIGGDGTPGIAELGLDSLDAAPEFVKLSARSAGEDTVEIYARPRQGS